MKINVFGTTEKLFHGLASFLFTAARTDQRDAALMDSRIPDGKCVRDIVAYLSAVVIISPQADLAQIHTNRNAEYPLSASDVRCITTGWKVILHS